MEMVTFEPCMYKMFSSISQVAENMSDLKTRDLFAISALNGILAQGDFHGSEKAYAEQSYAFADAMLEARKKKN